ncbi:MAG TPA: flippase [Ignavibacteria bacterium]|nr:flippase [Ignavibacteria bacterium]
MAFSKNSYWMKSGVYTILQRVTNLFTGFGSFFILVRTFDKDEMGAYALFLTVSSLIEVSKNGLIQNAQIKYSASASEEEYPKILSASFTLNVLIAVFLIIVLLILANPLSELWKSPDLKNMFYLYCITTLILVPFYQFNFIQQANLDFKGIFYSSLVRQGIFFTGILVSVIIGYNISLNEIVWLMTIGATLGTLVSYPFVKKFFRISKKIEWVWVKKLFHYGKYVFGTNVSSMIYSSIDQMMLGSLLGPKNVAVYNTAARVNNFVEVPLSAVAAIVFPQSAKRIETEGKQSVCYLYERSVGLLLAMIIPIIIITLLFTKEIIWVIAGDQYYSSIPILQLIILGTFLQPFGRQFGVVMDSIGKPNINFKLLVLIAVINIILNYIFITNFGTIGAAIGTMISLFIFFIINQIILKKEIGVKTHHSFIYMYKFYIEGFNVIKNKIIKTKQ